MYVFMFAYFFILLYFFVLWATAANTDVYINSKYISRRAKGMASRLRYPPLNYATKWQKGDAENAGLEKAGLENEGPMMGTFNYCSY